MFRASAEQKKATFFFLRKEKKTMEKGISSVTVGESGAHVPEC
jgi:hypothetical protein